MAQLLVGTNYQNLDFSALTSLLLLLGFEERIRGRHHIFSRTGVLEIINLQPAPGNTVKPYQAKQVRALLLQYRAGLHLDTF